MRISDHTTMWNTSREAPLCASMPSSIRLASLCPQHTPGPTPQGGSQAPTAPPLVGGDPRGQGCVIRSPGVWEGQRGGSKGGSQIWCGGEQSLGRREQWRRFRLEQELGQPVCGRELVDASGQKIVNVSQNFGRQSSNDTGHESGIGSDSDSGNGNVFYDPLPLCLHPAPVHIYAAPGFIDTPHGVQLSPDGRHPVFLTSAERLTSVDQRFSDFYQDDVGRDCDRELLRAMKSRFDFDDGIARVSVMSPYADANGFIYEANHGQNDMRYIGELPSPYSAHSNSIPFETARGSACSSPIEFETARGSRAHQPATADVIDYRKDIQNNQNVTGLMVKSMRQSSVNSERENTARVAGAMRQMAYNGNTNGESGSIPSQTARKQLFGPSGRSLSNQDSLDQYPLQPHSVRQFVPSEISTNHQRPTTHSASQYQHSISSSQVSPNSSASLRVFSSNPQLSQSSPYNTLARQMHSGKDDSRTRKLSDQHLQPLSLDFQRAAEYPPLRDPLEVDSGTSDLVDYTPEKLRRQCEALQMRLSQDFATPVRGGGFTTQEIMIEAALKQMARTAPKGHQQVISTNLDLLRSQTHVNRELTGHSRERLQSAADINNNSPPRYLVSNAGVVENPAFEADQPATLPRPGRQEGSESTQGEARRDGAQHRAPARRWTLVDRATSAALRVFIPRSGQKTSTVNQQSVSPTVRGKSTSAGSVNMSQNGLNIHSAHPVSMSPSGLERADSRNNHVEKPARIVIQQVKNSRMGDRSPPSPTASVFVKGFSTSSLNESQSPPSPDTFSKGEKPLGFFGHARSVSSDGDKQQESINFAPYLLGSDPKAKDGRYKKTLAFSTRVAKKISSAANETPRRPPSSTINARPDGIDEATRSEYLGGTDKGRSILSGATEDSAGKGRAFSPVQLWPKSGGSGGLGIPRDRFSIVSTTGRTRKEFPTFLGELKPIAWSEDGVGMARDGENVLTTEDASRPTRDSTGNQIIVQALIHDRPTPISQNPEANAQHTTETISHDNPTKYNSLKQLPKHLANSRDKSPRPPLPRSASCSTSHTAPTLHPDQLKSMKIPKNAALVLLGRQTSDSLSSDDHRFLTDISPVASREYTGALAGDQAIRDVGVLMEIVEALLVNSLGLATRERTITGEEFNAARDAFSGVARTFVDDCRQLVSSAARSREVLTQNVNRSMRAFVQLIARCRQTLLCLSAPDDKAGLVGIVRDVAVGYQLTVSAACRTVGKPLASGLAQELMDEVRALTAALGRLVQTLAKLEYVRLVRRF